MPKMYRTVYQYPDPKLCFFVLFFKYFSGLKVRNSLVINVLYTVASISIFGVQGFVVKLEPSVLC